MDRTNHLQAATRRMTTRTIAALCGIAAVTAATWLAWTSHGWDSGISSARLSR